VLQNFFQRDKTSADVSRLLIKRAGFLVNNIYNLYTHVSLQYFCARQTDFFLCSL